MTAKPVSHDVEREKFERFLINKGYALNYAGDGQYTHSSTQLNWIIWQEATAQALSGNLPASKDTWKVGGKKHVLDTYEKLHEGKIGAHWIWIALERITAGENEQDVMRDYGYQNTQQAEAIAVMQSTIDELVEALKSTQDYLSQLTYHGTEQWAKDKANDAYSKIDEALAKAKSMQDK